MSLYGDIEVRPVNGFDSTLESQWHKELTGRGWDVAFVGQGVRYADFSFVDSAYMLEVKPSGGQFVLAALERVPASMLGNVLCVSGDVDSAEWFLLGRRSGARITVPMPGLWEYEQVAGPDFSFREWRRWALDLPA